MIPGVVASQAGGGVVATSVTWNSADKNANIALSASDKTATKSAGGDAWAALRATLSKSTGKWYFEVRNDSSGGAHVIIGVAKSTATLAGHLGADSDGYGYYVTGAKTNAGALPAYGATYAVTDIIGVALDLDAGELTFYKNGVSQGVAYTGLSGTFFPAGSVFSQGNSILTCVARTYSLPSGFSDWA